MRYNKTEAAIEEDVMPITLTEKGHKIIQFIMCTLFGAFCVFAGFTVKVYLLPDPNMFTISARDMLAITGASTAIIAIIIGVLLLLFRGPAAPLPPPPRPIQSTLPTPPPDDDIQDAA